MKELHTLDVITVQGAGGSIYAKVTNDGWEAGFNYTF